MSFICRCDVCQRDDDSLVTEQVIRRQKGMQKDKFFHICTTCSSEMFKNVKSYQMLIEFEVKPLPNS